MSELAIPEEYEHGFVELRGLEEDQVHELVSALEDEPATLSRLDLQRRVEGKVGTAISPRALDSIMETLISLYALRDRMGLPLPDFAKVVSEMMSESYIKELEFADEEERERFEAKLIQLLSVDSLDIAARAADILYERERTIHGSPRIFTDIRPIFGTDPEEGPRGAVIVHTLKVSYHEGRRIRELFVALNTEHVNELIDVLDVPILKPRPSKSFSATHVQYIDVDEGW